jgi:hypothetical protein
MDSYQSRKFAIAYTFLVALPVLGLVGVLRSGRFLSAPLSVEGLWKMQADSNRLPTLACADYLAAPRGTAVAISQSGKDLTVNLVGEPGLTAAGVIEGTTLTAMFQPLPEGATQAQCQINRGLLLSATVDRKANPRSLTGSLSVAGCSSCPPVGIHGVRQMSNGQPH